MTMTDTNFFQTLGWADTFGRVGFVFGQEWRLFISISMIGYLVAALFMLFVELILGRLLGYHQYTMDSGGVHVHYFQPSPLTWFIYACQCGVYFLIIAISDGAQIQAIAEMYLGEKPSILGSIKSAWAKAGTLFCIGVVLALAMILPFLILLQIMYFSGSFSMFAIHLIQIVGFALSALVTIVTYHVYPAIMVEDNNLLGCLDRSFQLASVNPLYVVSVVFSFSLFRWGVNFLIYYLMAISSDTTRIMGLILSILFGVLFVSLGAV
jgi:hypothetical protein